jgi:hypothetical protein
MANEPLLHMEDGRKSFCDGLSSLVVVLFGAALLVGAVFGGIALFYNYENIFARLQATDIRLGQQLYNETASRKARDTLLEQQITQLTAELDAETLVRITDYFYLLYAIQNETIVRIAEELVIDWTIGNETAAREAIDIIFAGNITTLFNLTVIAEVFDDFSRDKFMQLMANISYMDELLSNETRDRNATDTALFTETDQQTQTLLYLNTTLIHEIHNRTVFEALLFETLAIIQSMTLNASNSVKTVNGQMPTNHDIQILSGNNGTLVITTTPGIVSLDNQCIRTINSTITPDPTTGDIAFVAGANVLIDTVGMPPNTWRVVHNTLAPTIQPNFVTASNMLVFGSGAIRVIAYTWNQLYLMTAPAGTGTYAVEFTVNVQARALSGKTAIFQLGMSTTNSVCQIARPEPSGCLTILDSTFLPVVDATSIPLDVTLRSVYLIPAGTTITFSFASRFDFDWYGYYYTVTYTQVD